MLELDEVPDLQTDCHPRLIILGDRYPWHSLLYKNIYNNLKEFDTINFIIVTILCI